MQVKRVKHAGIHNKHYRQSSTAQGCFTALYPGTQFVAVNNAASDTGITTTAQVGDRTDAPGNSPGEHAGDHEHDEP